MTEHLVALCYILLIAGGSFVVMQKPLTASLTAPADFARRRNLWLALTLITFLSHSFWIALLISAVVVAVGARRESNVVALYCALLFVAPRFDMQIPGLGLVNQLFEINHPRMLSLVLLLPVTVRLLAAGQPSRPRLHVADAMFLTYFGYVFVVNATADSITGLMRSITYVVLDHGLLYYVVTRTLVRREQMLDALASLTLGLAVVGMIGAFETARHWLVYESLRVPLGVPLETMGTYLMRETDDGGYLRAYVTTGHAIALGFMCMIALTSQIVLARSYAPRWLGVAVIGMLMAGLLAAVSRGPWLACAIAMVVGLVLGPGGLKRAAWLASLVPVIVLGLLLHPKGQKMIDLLPFVGNVEAGSVTYRTQLIDRATVVFWQNPIFGSLRYIENPVLEEMRQGQGIIDIVNSYLGVALAYGAIGLLLFVLPSLYALGASWMVSRRLARTDPTGEALGRALAATLLGILLAIGAVSQIFNIPVVHWLVVGLVVAYAAHAPSWQRGTAPRVDAAPLPRTGGRGRLATGRMARPGRHA